MGMLLLLNVLMVSRVVSNRQQPMPMLSTKTIPTKSTMLTMMSVCCFGRRGYGRGLGRQHECGTGVGGSCGFSVSQLDSMSSRSVFLSSADQPMYVVWWISHDQNCVVSIEFHMHSPKIHFAVQVNSFGWPDGPTSLEELFQWPRFNAVKLLKEMEESCLVVDRLKKVLARDVWVFDSYAGMGTGSWTLHMQHKHMTRQDLSWLRSTTFNHKTRMKIEWNGSDSDWVPYQVSCKRCSPTSSDAQGRSSQRFPVIWTAVAARCCNLWTPNLSYAPAQVVSIVWNVWTLNLGSVTSDQAMFF